METRMHEDTVSAVNQICPQLMLGPGKDNISIDTEYVLYYKVRFNQDQMFVFAVHILCVQNQREC